MAVAYHNLIDNTKTNLKDLKKKFEKSRKSFTSIRYFLGDKMYYKIIDIATNKLGYAF